MSAVPRFQQAMLTYEQHKHEIEQLGCAIDLLSNGDAHGALDVLMALRNHLQDSQQPRLTEYSQGAEAAR